METGIAGREEKKRETNQKTADSVWTDRLMVTRVRRRLLFLLLSSSALFSSWTIFSNSNSSCVFFLVAFGECIENW